jgi:hypothetical protein
LDGTGSSEPLHLPPHHLATHAVVLGMTGSGKSGLVVVMVEEALRSGVPVLVIDVKGDLPNLLLNFPSLAPEPFLPWVDGIRGPSDERASEVIAAQLAEERRKGLARWDIGENELRAYAAQAQVRVITPGSTAGEPLHVLSAVERRSPRWDTDLESARASLGAAMSLLLRLVGEDPDPARSRAHVLLSLLAERRLLAGGTAELGALLDDLANPPLEVVGRLSLDEFVSSKERRALAAALNTLLAAPTFASWRQGSTLDVGEWMAPKAGCAPATVLSVAHLDDEERTLVLGVVLEEVLSWVRSLPGAQRLKALVVFDEVYGFLPPHPSNPPTKRPIVALMKQARAFGVGVVIATQNPMDIDYRALGNAGLWAIGKLQTDADRERVVEALGAEGDLSPKALTRTIQRLAKRWFVLRNMHSPHGTQLFQPRWAMSYLRGPMTRSELQRALQQGEQALG